MVKNKPEKKKRHLPERLFSMSGARSMWSDIVGHVEREGERIVLTRYGKSLVALIPYEELVLLQMLEEKFGLANVCKILKNPKFESWGKLKAQLGL